MTNAEANSAAVSAQLKLSNMRNDMREINSLAASALRNDGNKELMIRTILRISRDAIYR